MLEALTLDADVSEADSEDGDGVGDGEIDDAAASEDASERNEDGDDRPDDPAEDATLDTALLTSEAIADGLGLGKLARDDAAEGGSDELSVSEVGLAAELDTPADALDGADGDGSTLAVLREDDELRLLA